jgi:steroid 5-alpha reductase family enzyme
MQWEMLVWGGYSALSVAAICFVLAELTGNCSQVDKIWSIAPLIYVWEYAHISNYQPKFVLMAIMVSLWGIRLTYNFSRRGAYSWKIWTGEEDYRWEVLRQNPLFNSKLKWSLFNLFFISFYQNMLIWLITIPAIYSFQENGNGEIGWKEMTISIVILMFLIFETIADQQQWNFQNEKHKRIREGRNSELPYSKGFVHTGLWSVVRHPNYASEQSIWIAFYFFSAVGTGNVLNGSLVGAVLLVLLFQGSADFSEGISRKKYAGYDEYIQSTPRFIPGLKKIIAVFSK